MFKPFRELLVRQSNWQGGEGESPNIQRSSKPEWPQVMRVGQ